jgi:hypothetical protein
MTDQIEELIKEIASKHGIAVPRDDPILVLQTINNRLMLDSAAAQQVQLDRYKEEIEALSMRWKADAKDKADRILNAALNASHEAMRSMIEQGAETTSKRFRAEIGTIFSNIERATNAANKASVRNLIASGITLIAAVLIFVGCLR